MSLIGLPLQPIGVAWPTAAWPQGELSGAAAGRVLEAVDYAFSPEALPDLGQTQALVIIQGGRLVLERYADGFGPDQTYPSWSKAKSITQALAGIAVGDGRLDIMAPADVPEWASADDARRAITLDLLLRMSGGLAFVEDYEPEHPSDVIAMLFGEGKDDVAHFAASMPLAHAPGDFWSYSSGTSNIVSRCVARAVDAFGADFEAFMRARLFEPLGMTSPVPKFDAAGTFIGSSYCFCTARDFARFGLLYLRDGVWDGKRILPDGWVDYARTPTWQQPTDERPYGAHWWLGLGGPGSFSANGYAGQFTIVVPDLDMVVVRNGDTPLARREAPPAWLTELIGRFRE
jgi:CubicO group peptidase (beta-lactamase class C family)